MPESSRMQVSDPTEAVNDRGYVCCTYCWYSWPIPAPALGMISGQAMLRCRRCDLSDPHRPPVTFAAGDWVVLHEKLPAIRIFDARPNEAGLLAITYLEENDRVHIGYCPPEFIRPAADFEPRRP